MVEKTLSLDQILEGYLCIFIELARIALNFNQHLNLQINEKVKSQSRNQVAQLKNDIENGYSVITLLSNDHLAQKYFPGVVSILLEKYSKLVKRVNLINTCQLNFYANFEN